MHKCLSFHEIFTHAQKYHENKLENFMNDRNAPNER